MRGLERGTFMRGWGARAWVAVGLLCWGAASPAAQEDVAGAGTGLRLSGFGTLAASYHDAQDTQFRARADQREGAQAGRLETGIDSVLGVQADVRGDARWSSMAQVVVRKDGKGEWAPRLSWGFVKYSPTPGLELRAGRLGVDIYLDGDSPHVGYAYTTVRPYTDLYGQLSFDRFDGVDLRASTVVGEGELSLKLYGGRTRGEDYRGGYLFRREASTTLGATLQWESTALAMRLAWGQVRTPGDGLTPRLAGALREIAPLLPPELAAQAGTRAAEMEGRNSNLSYVGLGMTWRHGPWSAQLLGVDASMNRFPGFEGWGVGSTLAYRAGAWKPFLTYSRGMLTPGARPLALPADQAELAPIRAAYALATGLIANDQYSWGVGVRYDLMPNAALKLQLDRIEAKRSSMLLDGSGTSVGPRGVSVFTAALDFVF